MTRLIFTHKGLYRYHVFNKYGLIIGMIDYSHSWKEFVFLTIDDRRFALDYLEEIIIFMKSLEKNG